MRSPPPSASMVMACMASVAGGRAASWAMAVPRRMRRVWAARYANGDNASVPYASALHTEWYPRSSARRTSSTGTTSRADR